MKTENLLEKNEVLLEKTEKLLLKTEELLENEVKQHKSPILAKPGNFIPLNTRTEENINKIDNKPNKIVNPHDKTPLSLIKNYTKQLLDKKNLIDSKKNRLSTQKSKSPNKKSPINTINTPSLVLMNNMKESIEINIGKDDYPLKNCQFCGKPFLESKDFNDNSKKTIFY